MGVLKTPGARIIFMAARRCRRVRICRLVAPLFGQKAPNIALRPIPSLDTMMSPLGE